MTPERYARLRSIFHGAMALPEDGRRAHVEVHAGDDAELRREALALLDAESHAGSGAPDPIARTLGAPTERPVRIGAYRIVRELGAGAVGTVYEAEQETPRRGVALKVLRRTDPSERLARRFELESEVLGRLVHPGIARVYDAGVAGTPAGPRHYIAMELVSGEPITRWARRTGAIRRERLGVFARVCDAVHHAHQRGVIHRDLKPANIFVTGEGEPKVLDFGIARALDENDASPMHTMQGEVLGTLDYMSPEQAIGEEGVDVRTDVYALGAVLFELVAGEPALDTQGLTLATALDAVRTGPRRRLRETHAETDADLELITATALDLDRDRRYASADALARDVRRLLAHEPILARAPSMSYQLMKFARRRRAAVAALGAIALVLVGATVVSVRAASVAQRERVEAQRTLELLTDAIAGADPAEGSPSDYTLRAFLSDFALALEDADPPPSPAAEAQLRGALGSSLIGLGLPREALPQLERAAALRARTLGDRHEKTFDARTRLAVARLDAGDTSRGLDELTEITRGAQSALGLTHQVTRDALYYLASAHFKAGDPEAARPIFQSLLDANRAAYGEVHEETVSMMSSLSLVLRRLGRFEEALELNERAAELEIELGGPDHPYTLTTRNNLGQLYVHFERYDEAMAIFDDVLERRRRTLPAGHRHIGVSLSSLALVCRQSGALETAERYALEAHAHFLEHQGPDHPYTAKARTQCAAVYEALNDPEQAAAWRE